MRIFRFLFLFVCLAAALYGAPKYVILLIGDGFGSAQRTLVERTQNAPLFMSAFSTPVRTKTANALGETTDSAASGTAIACGVKTVKGALGVDRDLRPVESLAERLKRRGFKIGIITSSPLNDATPAAHYAHVESRKNYRAITEAMAASGFDFFGGKPPRADKTQHKKDADAHTRAALEKNGYLVYAGADVLARAQETPLDQKLCLLQTPDAPHFGAPAVEPTLADFTREALRRLENPNGFFLMVEKGDIDYSGHANDAGKLVWEVRDFDEVVRVVAAFQKAHPDDTLVVLTADHETGGLKLDNANRDSLARLLRQKAASTDLQKQIKAIAKSGTPDAFEKALALLQDALFDGDAPLSQDERARIRGAWNRYVEALKDPARDGAIPGLESMYG